MNNNGRLEEEDKLASSPRECFDLISKIMKSSLSKNDKVSLKYLSNYLTRNTKIPLNKYKRTMERTRANMEFPTSESKISCSIRSSMWSPYGRMKFKEAEHSFLGQKRRTLRPYIMVVYPYTTVYEANIRVVYPRYTVVCHLRYGTSFLG